METDVKEPKPATAVKAKPSKPGAPLQRTLIALARAPKDAKNADEERHYLLIGYAVAVEEALAEARRRSGISSSSSETPPDGTGENDSSRKPPATGRSAKRALAQAAAFEVEGNLGEARHARIDARDYRASAEKLTAILEHFSKASAS